MKNIETFSRRTSRAALMRDILWLVGVVGLCLMCALTAQDHIIRSWINPDEGIYLLAARKPSVVDVIQAAVPHAHPPLYYLFLKLLHFLGLGYPEFCRLLSLTFLLGAAFLAAVFFKRRFGLIASIGMVAFFTITPAAEVMAAVTRPYAALVFFLTIHLLALIKMQAPPKAASSDAMTKIIGSIALGLAILTHYSAVFFLFAELGAIALRACFSSTKIKDFIDGGKSYLFPIAALFLAFCSNLIFTLQNPTLSNFSSSWSQIFPKTAHDVIYAWGSTLDFLGSPLLILWLLSGILILLISTVANRPHPFHFLLLSTLILLGLHTGMPIFGLYPLGNTRHMSHLLPLLMLPLSVIATQPEGWVTAKILSTKSFQQLNLMLAPLLLIYTAHVNPPSGRKIITDIEFGIQRNCIEAALQDLSISEPQKKNWRLVALDQQTLYSLAPVLDLKVANRSELAFPGLSSPRQGGDIHKAQLNFYTWRNIFFTSVNSYCLQDTSEVQQQSLRLRSSGIQQSNFQNFFFVSNNWCRQGRFIEGSRPDFCAVSVLSGTQF